jgi:Putative restriction endonuclease
MTPPATRKPAITSTSKCGSRLWELDHLGFKRLLYEELGVREYWVVDVENARILAFQILDRGSQRITTSNVLPGLEIATLEAAFASRKTQDDSQIMATLMTQFSA